MLLKKIKPRPDNNWVKEQFRDLIVQTVETKDFYEMVDQVPKGWVVHITNAGDKQLGHRVYRQETPIGFKILVGEIFDVVSKFLVSYTISTIDGEPTRVGVIVRRNAYGISGAEHSIDPKPTADGKLVRADVVVELEGFVNMCFLTVMPGSNMVH